MYRILNLVPVKGSVIYLISSFFSSKYPRYMGFHLHFFLSFSFIPSSLLALFVARMATQIIELLLCYDLLARNFTIQLKKKRHLLELSWPISRLWLGSYHF